MNSHTSNPEFEKLKHDLVMEGLRDRTVPVNIAYLLSGAFMNLPELLAERESHRKAIGELNKKIKVAGINDLKAKFKEVLAKHPTVQSFAWTQYTDYFNDGDPCNFHVHAEDELIEINGRDWRSKQELTEEEAAVQRAVADILAEWDEYDMEEFFGDHKKIVVTADEIHVNSYSNHD